MLPSKKPTRSRVRDAGLRGGASRYALALAAFGAIGCGGYTTTSTARLADPHLVAVYVETPRGGTEAVLPAGSVAARATIPRADDAAVVRGADGSLKFEYDEPFGITCRPLTADGVLRLDEAVCRGRFHVDATMLRAEYTYVLRQRRMTQLPATLFTVTMTTPLNNVVEVRERLTPERAGGWLWLLAGSALTIAGSALLVSAFRDPEETRRAVAVPGILAPLLIGGGGVMISFGVSHAFVPARETILYSRPGGT